MKFVKIAALAAFAVASLSLGGCCSSSSMKPAPSSVGYSK
jgi:hypothetical protein